jgi:hypothetical protein
MTRRMRRMSKPAPQHDALLQRALAFVRLLRDPALPGLLLMSATILVGFGALFLGWRGAARTVYVALQLPHIASAAIGGLALIGLGVALFNLQMDRRYVAREQELTDEVIDEVAALVALARELGHRRKAH